MDLAALLNFLLMASEAVMMLFQLRALLQSSSADYYHPLTQGVIKLTGPVMNILPFKNLHLGSFFIGGFIVSFIVAAIFWIAIYFAAWTGQLGILYILFIAILMTIKTFGYLLLGLLFIQAITSWLPSTRKTSYLCYQITAPIVAPVQKIIPPIGMIDISLMIVMIVLFALNRLFASWFGIYWIML
ncbi:MAG: YggT family protein [Succinivibrio sp.]|nr:YggT family protein [Succinivibrio sp.]